MLPGFRCSLISSAVLQGPLRGPSAPLPWRAVPTLIGARWGCDETRAGHHLVGLCRVLAPAARGAVDLFPPPFPAVRGRGPNDRVRSSGAGVKNATPAPLGSVCRFNQVKGAASPLPSPVRCSGYALRAACGLGQALELVSARLSARVKNVLTTIDYYPTLSYYCPIGVG